MKGVSKKVREFYKSYAILPFGQMAATVAVAMLLSFFVMPPVTLGALQIMLYTAPLWILLKVKQSVMYYWVHYVQHAWIDLPGQKPVLLEIRLPNHIEKSPRAMEMVFEALHFKPQYTTAFQKKWKGHVMPWYSFEMVYAEGKLKFYIWTWRRVVPRVEGAIYSQYPDIQLVEVPDYADEWKHWGTHNKDAWGCGFMLSKPRQTYPIQTYIDWELDKDPKEEYRVDPFLSMLELMTSAFPTEIVAFQIMFQPDIAEVWKKNTENEIKKVYDTSKPKYKVKDKDGHEKEVAGFSQLRPMDYERVRAMERHLNKHSFYVGVRGIYMAPKGKFYTSHASPVVQHFFNAINSRGSDFYNTITADPERHTMGFDWPWEDWAWDWPRGWKGFRKRSRVHHLLQAWALRSYFHPPYIEEKMELTTEELATIFHFPGSEAAIPGLKRLDSNRAGPPVNLPVE